MTDLVQLPLAAPDDGIAPCWYWITTGNGHSFSVIRCKCGRVYPVQGTVALDGTVSGEFQCRRKACGWRAHVRLAHYERKG